jgi:CBS domain-containing protein
VSNLSGESRSPGTEFLIAIVGPLTSFAIAIVAFGLAALAGESALGLLFSYVAFVNVLLGLFNLIPGYPLDGGRVLRSIAWRVTNSVRRATEIAAGAGQLFGFALILWGLSMLLLPPAGDFFNGLWIGAIGWFLQSSATASLQQVIMETRLRDVRVGQVFDADPACVEPDVTVAELIEGHLLRRNRRAMPVCDDGRPVGIVTLGDIKEVPADARASTSVAEVMGGRDGLATVTPSDRLSRALELFGAHEYEQLPVVEKGRFLGLLTRADLIRQLQLREELDVVPRAI